MRKIKLAYSDLYNAGDLMNVDIVEKLSGAKVKRSKTFCAEMMAIGGAIYGLQYSDRLVQNIVLHLLHPLYDSKPIYIWGSGFWHDRNTHKLYRSNLKVCALRGALSQKKLFELTGHFYDVPLADGGLLIDELIPRNIEKEYSLGVIPHLSQQNEVEVMRLKATKGVHIIDIKKKPEEVGKEIAKCETVLSSSLHGLIFADALGIPNMHVRLKKELPEGNFKFEDYYSSYGLNDPGIYLDEHIPSYDEIKDNYHIPQEMVKEKKATLIETFPDEFKQSC